MGIGWGLVLTLTQYSPLVAQSPPNIVLIYTDDLGYASLGSYGQQEREVEGLPALHTPHLDALAAEGMRFTQHYAPSPTCAPSRASLMTGLHTGHVNIRANRGYNPGNEPLDSLPTIAGSLQAAGYRTIAIGKWGLGGESGQQFEGHPLRRGFDEFFGVLDQTQCHQQYLDRITALNPNAEIWQNYDRLQPGIDVPETYANNLFGQRALESLSTWHDSGPFFIYLALTTPHARMEAPPAGIPLPADTSSWPDVEKLYASMVSSLDHQVGRIVRALDSLGIAEQTLLLFTSDNGPHDEVGSLGTTPPHDWEFFDENAPLRGRKRQLLEGGIRVPLIATWPGTIAAGAVTDLPCAAWDFFPTLAELSGATIPSGLDGLSFVPTLTGTGIQQRHFAFYWEFDDLFFRQAVRMGRWKALRNGHTAQVQLYDLDADPGEVYNQARNLPGLADKLAQYFLCLRVPSADFASPVDSWPIPDCDPLIAELVEPLPDSRVVLPELSNISLTLFGAAIDEQPVELRLFWIHPDDHTRIEWPTTLREDGYWQSNWLPPFYGFHRFVLRAEHPDGRFAEFNTALEVGECPLVVLDPSTWSLIAVDSEESEAAANQATRAFDNNPGTFWHTQWFNDDPPPPHFIEVALGSTYRVGGLDYVPRPGPSENGVIADFALFLVLDDERNDKVAGGNWPWPEQLFTRSLRFPSRDASRFRLEAYSEINGGPWTSAAELRILIDSCAVYPDTATTPPPLGLPGLDAADSPLKLVPNPLPFGRRVELSGHANQPLAVEGTWHWCGVGGNCQPAKRTPFTGNLQFEGPPAVGNWWLRSPDGKAFPLVVN